MIPTGYPGVILVHGNNNKKYKKPLMGPGAFLVINYTETASVSMGEGETPGHHMTPYSVENSVA